MVDDGTSKPEFYLRSTGIHIALIVLVSFLAYFNTLGSPFIFDDELYIVNNPTIKDFGYFIDPEKAEVITLEPDVARYLKTRMVSYLTFLANYKAGGLGVGGFHAVNLIIHILNSILVYILLRLTFLSPYVKGVLAESRLKLATLIGGLMFSVHPVQTEAVTYITQRFASLCALFCLLSITAYAYARLTEKKLHRRLAYTVSVLSALFAMFTKENAFVLPLLVGLYEYIFFSAPSRKRIILLLPLLLTMLVVPSMYIEINSEEGGFLDVIDTSTRLNTNMPRAVYLFTQARVLVTYLRLMVLPINQNINYDYPLYSSFLEQGVLVSSLLLMGVFALGVYLLGLSNKTGGVSRLPAFGIFWFFISLSVESSIIPISELIFEYRLYLPLVGMAVAVAGGISFVCMRFGSICKALVAGLAAVLIMFLVLSVSRNALWRTGIGVWEDAVKKSPSMVRPHYNLGVFYEKAGRDREAAREYLAVLTLYPGHAKAHNNLGFILFKRGHHEEALGEIQEAIRLAPEFAYLRRNLAYVYMGLGRNEDAIAELLEALKLDPNDADTHNDLGAVYTRLQRYEDAVLQYHAALDIRPGDFEVLSNLGVVYAEMGRYDEAEMTLKWALEIKPGDKRLIQNLEHVRTLLLEKLKE